MFERNENRFNTASSWANADECACASSFSAANENMVLLLTLGTALAVSIFAVLSLIICLISLLAVIISGSVFLRPYLEPAQ